jgi:hypothetical protein
MANKKPPKADLPRRIKISKFLHDVLLTEYSFLKTIRIKPQQEHELEILFHELLHGIFASYNLHYQVRRLGVQPKQMEEFIVGNLAKGIAQVLKDNPDLATYIGFQCRARQSPDEGK